jgi:signal transduction histidine kinase
MRRNFSTIVLALGIATLLAVLGVLQYRWQSQISDNEREKMHRRAQEQAGHFAEDFNKQIQSSYFNFQIGAEDWRSGNYHAFVERYDFWRSKIKYPGLVHDFYFFDAAGKDAPVKYDKEARTFTPVEWTDELRDIFSRAKDNNNFHAVNDDIFTLILPEYEDPPKVHDVILRRSPSGPEPPGEAERMMTPRTFGYLAVQLDPEVITGALLPDLASQYFGEGDFHVAVTDSKFQTVFRSGDVAPEPDAQANLFELSPNDIFFFANRDLVNSIGERGELKKSVVMNSHVENRTITHAEIRKESLGSVKIDVQNGGSPKTEIFTTSTDGMGAHWTLAVQHTAGSIDTYIANTKFRNLATGFGILALLGLSAAAMIFSAQRVKSFAQRQIDFVSSVSHEFRTPIAVIYSAGENLADGVTNDPSQTSKYGELIKGEGRKLSAMVEQILEFAGANSSRRKFNFHETSIAEIVEDAVNESKPLLEGQQIEMEIEIEPSLPVANADAEALSRAIQNLIANSVKYRNGSNWLRISAYNGDNTIKISVEDRGIGISKRDLSKIFEPFYRSKDVVDAQIHGNGLGLSLVKQIVEAHGGHVNAASEVGKGSVFTIEIPSEES